MDNRVYLITLSSPIAIRNDLGDTRLVNVIEAYIETGATRDVRWLRINRWFNSQTQLMEPTKLCDVEVKASNIRGRQEVR